MKICYLNYHNPLMIHGGAERVVLGEAELVAQSGNEVIILTTHAAKELLAATFQKGKIKVWFLPNLLPLDHESFLYKSAALLLSLHNPILLKYVSRILKMERPDIVHIHNYGPMSIGVINVAKRFGCKVIQTVHGYYFECPKGSLYKRSGEVCNSPLPICKIYKKICQKTMLKCDSIIAISSYVKERLVKAGYSAGIVSFIPNSINKITQPPIAEPTGKEILFVGRMVKAKGVHVLIKALAKVKNACNEKLTVSLIGDGEHKTYFESLAQSYGVDVNFLGRVSDRILEEYYNNAYFVVVPSLFSELFCIVILEAMSYGKPVIASNIGGIPELVLHGQTGFLFEPEDADALAKYIQILLDDEELALNLGNRALKVSQKFSGSSHLKLLLNLYEKVSLQGSLRT